MLENTKFMRTKTGKCSRGEFLHTPLNMPQTEYPWEKLCPSSQTTTWVLTIWQKNLVGCQKQNGKQFTSLPQNFHIHYGLNPKKARICVASGTEKLVNGKQHSVWFVPTGMNRLRQNVLLNLPSFHPGFPKFSVKR